MSACPLAASRPESLIRTAKVSKGIAPNHSKLTFGQVVPRESSTGMAHTGQAVCRGVLPRDSRHLGKAPIARCDCGRSVAMSPLSWARDAVLPRCSEFPYRGLNPSFSILRIFAELRVPRLPIALCRRGPEGAEPQPRGSLTNDEPRPRHFAAVRLEVSRLEGLTISRAAASEGRFGSRPATASESGHDSVCQRHLESLR